MADAVIISLTYYAKAERRPVGESSSFAKKLHGHHTMSSSQPIPISFYHQISHYKPMIKRTQLLNNLFQPAHRLPGFRMHLGNAWSELKTGSTKISYRGEPLAAQIVSDNVSNSNFDALSPDIVFSLELVMKALSALICDERKK